MATPALADVTLTGEGEVSAAPDVGYVTVGVVSEAETAADSVAANTAAMSKLYESMNALGIDKKHVETSQFSLQAKYEYQDK